MDLEDQLIKFGDYVKGTCELMCPISERNLRERERLLHPLEQLIEPNLSEHGKASGNHLKKTLNRQNPYQADPAKIVKSYSRSAAGHKMPAPSDLRPFPVLEMTVLYLIKEVACKQTGTSGWVDRYNFVTDRLRSVRQDMVIQNLSPREGVKLLDPMVKFHVFAGYWLCEKPISLFDPKMNFSFLHECIQHLLVIYDLMRATEDEKLSTNSLPTVPKISTKSHCEDNEHTIRALHHLLNLGSAQILSQGSVRQFDAIRECEFCVECAAFQLSLAAWRGNYARVCKLIQKLPPLLAMAAAIHLPSIRRHALVVMTTAYTSKTLKFPVSTLQNILLWNSRNEVIEECKHYGINVEKSQDASWSIHFQKGILNMHAKQMQPSRLLWLDELFSNVSLINILAN